MWLSLRPDQKKYLLVPVLLGCSFFVDHYKGRIWTTLQADASLTFIDPTRDIEPMHTYLSISPQQHFHEHLLTWTKHPTEKSIFALVDHHHDLEMKVPLPPLEMVSPTTDFVAEKRAYKKTTDLARILDYCHDTWDEVSIYFSKRSTQRNLTTFPAYQRYVKLQYAYAKHHSGKTHLLSPKFFKYIDELGDEDAIGALLALYSVAPHTSVPDFVSFDHDSAWSQQRRLEKDNVCQTIATEHLPHGQAENSLTNAGMIVCSSFYGFDECGREANTTKTCLHGLQPIVVTWCTLLQQQVQEVYALSRSPQIVIRWGTETGHDGEATWVAGQMAPQFEHKITLTGRKHYFAQARLQGAYKLFALHGFGNAIDIGVYDAPSAWALHAFLDQGTPLIYGFRYRALWPDCFVIAQSHGRGAWVHHHVSFVSALDMQYILDDLRGEGRNRRIDPHDTLMHQLEQQSESDDTVQLRMLYDSLISTLPKESPLDTLSPPPDK